MKGVQPSTLWRHSQVGRPAAPGQGVPRGLEQPHLALGPSLGLRVGAMEGERWLRG